MNPSGSGYAWNNPPPPGTEFDSPDEDIHYSSQKNESSRSSKSADVYIKKSASRGREDQNSERVRCRSRSTSLEYKKKHSSKHSHSRSKRSRSRSRRSRTRSRERRRRSRSRRRRRKHSSSRSRSRSHSPRHRHKKSSRHYTRSRSRSHSYSSRGRSHRSDRDKKRSRSPRIKEESDRHSDLERKYRDDVLEEEDMKLEDADEEASPEHEPAPIPFKNDGSFLEMFKKMQEQQKVKEEPPEQAEIKKPVLPAFGKRRGGKVLKTGMVAKVKNVEEENSSAQDAWTIYMKEVRKYKEAHCDDDSKTRPLVK